MFIGFKRIIKFGWQGFWRNKGLSLQVIFIMVVAVFAVTFLFLFEQVSAFLIEQSEKKVDISVYFQKDAPEENILELKEELTSLTSQVKSVEYISKELAKEIFIEKHQDDKFYLEALEQVESNPFLASLNIKAFFASQYGFIADFLQQKQSSSFIEKISYSKNKQVIDRLFYIVDSIKKIGLLASAFIGLLIILITFNTIKLTIFSMKDEVITGRLVGASNWFIRGPFLVQGLLYALFSVIVFDIVFIVAVIFLSAKLQVLFLDFNLLAVLRHNAAYLIAFQTVFTLFCGTVSSILATRKYLKM